MNQFSKYTLILLSKSFKVLIPNTVLLTLKSLFKRDLCEQKQPYSIAIVAKSSWIGRERVQINQTLKYGFT